MSHTLAALIATYEAHRGPQTALTTRGAAVRSVYTLRSQMAVLEPAERAEVIALAVAELDILPPAPLPAELDERWCLFHGEYSPDTFDCPVCPAHE